MIGTLTYTDILIIILIYVAVAALAVSLYPELVGRKEKRQQRKTVEIPKVEAGIPKTVMAEYKKERKKQTDDFYTNLFSKSEEQVAEEMGLNSEGHEAKPKKNLKKKKHKVNHNKA